MKFLKFTVIWNILISLIPISFALFLKLDNFFSFWSMVLLIIYIPQFISGILFSSYLNSNNNMLARKVNTILGLSILNVVFGNLVGGIVGIIASQKIYELTPISESDNFDNVKKSKNVEKTEAKKTTVKVQQQNTNKLDILLNLGVFLTIFSGLIFATSNWNVIDNVVKVFIIFAMSCIFGTLSYLFKTKLKNQSSEIVYFILSATFLILTIVSLFAFKLLGNYLTFTGLGSNICYSIVFAMIGLSTYTLVKLYKKIIGYILHIYLITFPLFCYLIIL